MRPTLLGSFESPLTLTSSGLDVVLQLINTEEVKEILIGLRKADGTKDRIVYLVFERMSGEGIISPIDIYMRSDLDEPLDDKTFVDAIGLFGIEAEIHPLDVVENSVHNRSLDVTQIFTRALNKTHFPPKSFYISMRINQSHVLARLNIGSISLYVHS